MKVLILTQWYPPEPGLLMQELAQTLMTYGHEVTVLTGFPNFPSGHLYPGYRLKFVQREKIAGVPIVRVPLYPEHSRSSVKRAFNYVSFALSASVFGGFFLPKPDIMFVYHPPLTVGVPAYVLSRLWRIPFVYQIQDMWPETLGATGMLSNNTILRFVGRFARFIYAKAAAICVISPGFRENLIGKQVPSEKICVISNWVDPDAYYIAEPDPDLAKDLGLSGKFNVMFAGIIGAAQGLDVVLNAAKLLGGLKDIQFVLVGDGIALKELKETANNEELDNVLFLGRFPQRQMPALYALADVLLIILRDDPLFRITIPHKTLTYLASGKPILAAVAGDTAEVVLQAGAGIACKPGDPESLAKAVQSLYSRERDALRQMGLMGRQAAQNSFSRDQMVGRIEGILLQTAKSP